MELKLCSFLPQFTATATFNRTLWNNKGVMRLLFLFKERMVLQILRILFLLDSYIPVECRFGLVTGY